MKLIADMHCHTQASGHAYSTVLEIAKEASKKGLYAVAITDHAESPGHWYFHNMISIPRNLFGVNILRGIEANIINDQGEIDVPKDLVCPLDWVIASMHEDILEDKTLKQDYTDALLEVAENSVVNVLGHSGRYNFIYDCEKVIRKFGENGKLIEINNNSFSPYINSYEKCKKIAEICLRCSVNVVVSTDAHFSAQVGEFDDALRLLKDINFPEELVVNSSVERMENYIKNHTGFFTYD